MKKNFLFLICFSFLIFSTTAQAQTTATEPFSTEIKFATDGPAFTLKAFLEPATNRVTKIEVSSSAGGPSLIFPGSKLVLNQFIKTPFAAEDINFDGIDDLQIAISWAPRFGTVCYDYALYQHDKQRLEAKPSFTHLCDPELDPATKEISTTEEFDLGNGRVEYHTKKYRVINNKAILMSKKISKG